MREGKKINGLIFYSSYSVYDFFFKENVFGFSKKLLSVFYKRFETRIDNKLKNLKTSEMICLNKIFFKIIPENKEFKKKVIMNIYFIDLINTYRGVRHSFGLPSRGQRTWTNAWSSYRSNLLLRQFKLKTLRRMYATATIKEINTSYYAEAMNNLWKIQWEKEWKEARRQRLAQSRRDKNFYKTDLDQLASGVVSVKGKKKKKTYLIGFEPGFTKFVLKQSIRFKLKNKLT